MRTNYSSKNAEFSDNAHLAAQTQLYPFVFNAASEKLSFETVTMSNNPRHKVLDGEMAVDRIVNVTVESFNFPLTYTVQERFRRTDAMKWQDVTITEKNHCSGLPSELYKLSGGLFVYGYYDDTTNEILQFVVFSSTALLVKLATGELNIDKRGVNPRSRQSFVAFKFDTLRTHGLILRERCIYVQ